MLLELSSCQSKEDSTTKHKQGSAVTGMIFFYYMMEIHNKQSILQVMLLFCFCKIFSLNILNKIPFQTDNILVKLVVNVCHSVLQATSSTCFTVSGRTASACKAHAVALLLLQILCHTPKAPLSLKLLLKAALWAGGTCLGLGSRNAWAFQFLSHALETF